MMINKTIYWYGKWIKSVYLKTIKGEVKGCNIRLWKVQRGIEIILKWNNWYGKGKFHLYNTRDTERKYKRDLKDSRIDKESYKVICFWLQVISKLFM